MKSSRKGKPGNHLQYLVLLSSKIKREMTYTVDILYRLNSLFTCDFTVKLHQCGATLSVARSVLELAYWSLGTRAHSKDRKQDT